MFVGDTPFGKIIRKLHKFHYTFIFVKEVIVIQQLKITLKLNQSFTQ